MEIFKDLGVKSVAFWLEQPFDDSLIALRQIARQRRNAENQPFFDLAIFRNIVSSADKKITICNEKNPPENMGGLGDGHKIDPG